MLVAKSAEASRSLSSAFRERRVTKYYVAISEKKPKKKMGRVRGDMVRSRRGQWMLTRQLSNPASTYFLSEPLDARPAPRHAFLIKPLTGRTHQIRVALKSLGSPVLGDPRYALQITCCVLMVCDETAQHSMSKYTSIRNYHNGYSP